MKFRGFSKSLSDEVENLCANLGDGNNQQQAHRLDNNICMSELLERIKNLDLPATHEKPSP